MKYHVTLARDDVFSELAGSHSFCSLDDFNKACTAFIVKNRTGTPSFCGTTSFSQNVISSNRRFAEMQFRRIVILPKQKITESNLTESLHGRIVEFEKIHNAERHFSELFVQPNVVFLKHHLPKPHFAEH